MLWSSFSRGGNLRPGGWWFCHSHPVERWRGERRPIGLTSTSLYHWVSAQQSALECLGVPWSRCPGDYISTSGGRGQVLRFFKASRCLQGACHSWAELLLSLCWAISLLQIPAASSRVCPRLGTFNTALWSLPKFIPPLKAWVLESLPQRNTEILNLHWLLLCSYSLS